MRTTQIQEEEELNDETLTFVAIICTEMWSCFRAREASEIDSEVYWRRTLCSNQSEGAAVASRLATNPTFRGREVHFYGDGPTVLPGRSFVVPSPPSLPNVYRTLRRVAFFAPLHGYIPQLRPSPTPAVSVRVRVRSVSLSRCFRRLNSNTPDRSETFPLDFPAQTKT